MLDVAHIPSPSRGLWSRRSDVVPAGHRDEREADRLAEHAVGSDRAASPTSLRSSPQASTGSRGGRPLEAGTREFFEQRFGADFGGVRVHTDDRATRAARALGASAFTVGRDIAFDSGEYQPGTASGRRLLAHELAHTLQPCGVVRRKLRVSSGVDLDLHGFSATRAGDVYTGVRITKSSVNNEVFSALLHSPRTFEVEGSTSREADRNLDKHVKARMGIINFASKKRYAFAAGSAFRMNPDYWNVGSTSFDLKSGADPWKAIDDLNVHPEKYAIACQAATALTMHGGSRSALTQDNGVADTDWIPGDWGYIDNTKFPSGGPDGQEGENIIYTGQGKYWGHFGPGLKYKTLEQWFDLVKSWHGGAQIRSHRRRPTVGLV
jgi:hypothetical protein